MRKRPKRRPQGGVYLRGRTWWAKWSEPGGKRARVNLHVSVDDVDEDGARLEMDKVKAEQKVNGPPIAGRLTFPQMVDLLRNDYVAQGNKSWDRAEYAVDRLSETFGKSRASDITATALDAYLAGRLKTVKRATVRIEFAILRRMFTLAAKRKLVRAEDVPAFPDVAPGERRRGFFERADFENVREHLPPHLQDVFTFAYLVGARRGEILGLQWSAVSMASHTVTLERTKNDEDRILDFRALPELADVMRRRDDARKALARDTGHLTPWVFWHRKGEPVRDFRHLWREACKAAKVPGKLFHDLRRTATRSLIRAGVSQTVAMAITGHRSADVFARYNITDTRDIRAALAALSQSEHSGTVSGTSKR